MSVRLFETVPKAVARKPLTTILFSQYAPETDPGPPLVLKHAPWRADPPEGLPT